MSKNAEDITKKVDSVASDIKKGISFIDYGWKPFLAGLITGAAVTLILVIVLA